MARKKYCIELTSEQKELLEKIAFESTEPARTILRAKILLESAKSDDKKSVLELAEELETTHTTVQITRTAFCNDGLEAAVFRKQRVVSTKNRKFNDKVIEQIIALSETDPPGGKKRWSQRMLCKACIEEGIVDSISLTKMNTILREANVKLMQSIC